MKNIFLSCLLIFLIKSLSIAQITATDYTLNDCAGNPHHLFAELDEGKVMVISFVMPCLSCIGPTIASSDDVANFEERTQFVLEMAKKYKFRGLTRLHIAAWNKTLNV